MYRRTTQRGIAALAFVLLLTLVGTQPAAAATTHQGFLDRLASFWGAITGTSTPQAQAPSLWDTVTGWFGFTDKAATSDTGSTPDKGWGIDPNGNSLLNDPAPKLPSGGL
jgi:hypothetical protein